MYGILWAVFGFGRRLLPLWRQGDSCLRRNGLLVYGRLWADFGFGRRLLPLSRQGDSCFRRNGLVGNAKESPKYAADCPPPPTIARRTTTNAKIIHTLSFPHRPFLRRQESILNMCGNAASLRRQCRNLRRRWRQMKE